MMEDSTDRNLLRSKSNYEEEDGDVVSHLEDESDKQGGSAMTLLRYNASNTEVEQEPGKIEGYLLKRRKRPMKGWHKRYFVLEKGMLTYGKTVAELQKGKIHGTIDIGTSVINTEKEEDKKARRIDIDNEEFLYHLKSTSHEEFLAWKEHLQKHQTYRKRFLASKRESKMFSVEANTPTSNVTLKALTLEKRRQTLKKQQSSRLLSNQERVAMWVRDTSALDVCQKDLSDAEDTIVELSNILQDLLNTELPPYSDPNADPEESLTLKKKAKKSLKKSKQRKPSEEIGSDTKKMRPLSNPTIFVGNPLFDDDACSVTSGFSTLSYQETEGRRREEFFDTAGKVHRSFKTLLHTLTQQHEKLSQMMKMQAPNASLYGGNCELASLREALTKANSSNAELRGRLSRIFKEADIGDLGGEISIPIPSTPLTVLDETIQHDTLVAQASTESKLSRSESLAEFFDAQEYLRSVSSDSEEEEEEFTEAEDDQESSSQASEADESEIPSEEFRSMEELSEAAIPGARSQTGRRTQLPYPQPDTSDISIWNILKKNIGKDLSKIAMPVIFNEPLSMLQVLCEELEYSELLDKAAETDNPYKRMVYIAAFAVSSYSSTYYRARTKPFNPLLGETYECVREDKGFKYVSEQVSHHPPVSACHCEAKQYTYWQDARIKTKFWGKSMEILPAGTINITIPKYNDHYTYTKVTSCVHNILSGQRWIDHYGETVIKNGDIICKLNFTKASYWSNRRHEINGCVMNENGETVHEIFGKWNESIYCGQSSSAKCIWRTGCMPEDHQLYYGLTRFAIELNELDSHIQPLLPYTDSRFRPDQRLLEEGDVKGAEKEKQRLESLQRERRKQREELKQLYDPKFFKSTNQNGKEFWVFKGDYWELRDNNQLKDATLPNLW
ncbi:oxysterol-binding protein-related protein 6-like [Antedon mediterranea]|uniref:oxysterol-binding protein-related protein 6-like n=1 Tax=Antedon mediterranea TaxID=105859 RepID=UPI003AF9E6F7